MMREEPLPFALPDLDETEIQAITGVLRSGWITMGPKVFEFEEAFADFVGAPYALAVNSCTAALHLALEAADVGPGDFVVTTTYTFAATAEVIRYLEAIPLFVDIDPETLNLDPEKTAQVLTEAQRSPDTNPRSLSLRRGLSSHRSNGGSNRAQGRPKAIIPVHYAGQPCEMDALNSLADKHGLAVIEDAAHAFPAAYRGNRIGAASSDRPNSATCFSFYATKPLTTGEGGMITTANEAWVERMRYMRLHGINQDAWNRYSIDGSWAYDIIAPGFKYNMTDLAAAMGLVQLQKAEECWGRRVEIANRYYDAFSQSVALCPPIARSHVQHAWHLYPLRLNLERLKINRSQFLLELRKRKIGASVHYIPLHMHPYYRELYGYRSEDFPHAHREFEREVSLPIFSKMSDSDVADVIEATLEIASENRTGRRHRARSGH